MDFYHLINKQSRFLLNACESVFILYGFTCQIKFLLLIINWRERRMQ